MKIMLRVIDSISEYTGKVARWLCLFLVIVLVYEVSMRYIFDAPTMWAHQTSCMLGGSIIALGWAYVHRYHGHVRIDVLYTRLSSRGKAAIDVLGHLFVFFPLMFIFIYTSASRMLFSWSMDEVLILTYWYPPAGPVRTVIFLGFSLFALQGVAQLIRDSYLLIRNKSYD